jgi:hypothetical protein
MMASSCPEFAGLLFFLYVFWENLGDVTRKICGDHQPMKTERLRKWSLGAKMEAYCVRMRAMRSIAKRTLRGQGEGCLETHS